MSQTVADHLLERLTEWGVERIYGYPGDGINGLMGALNRADERFQFVQVRHEEMAAFMACAHAKFTGQTGVCMATSGPGAIHLLNGLYDARMDHQPVVAIVGQQALSALGGDYQQEVDLPNPVQGRRARIRADGGRSRAASACRRSRVPDRGGRADGHLHRAAQRRGRPGGRPAPPRQHGTVHSAAGYTAPVVVPSDEELTALRRC